MGGCSILKKLNTLLYCSLLRDIYIYNPTDTKRWRGGGWGVGSCSILNSDADPDPDLWIRICIIKVGSGSVWRDTNTKNVQK